jgi:S1-C subfamily serine protease
MQHTQRLILLSLFLCLPVCAQKAKSPADIIREQGQAVVVVEALDARGLVSGQGSGFIATSNGAVVTNLHVIQGATQARVKLPNGDVYKTDALVDFDDTKDLAVLKIKGFKLPVVTFGDSDKTEIGENIVVISSPEGLTNSLSTGVISGVRRLETLRVFQITAPISEGSSGGALFDTQGNVVAIVTYVLRGGQNINFAVPVNYVRGLVSDEANKTFAQLPPKPSAVAQTPASQAAPPNAASEGVNNAQLSTVVRARLGKTANEPLFNHPAAGLTFFYRLVEGLNITRDVEIADMLRTAAVEKTSETATTESFVVHYLTSNIGLALSLNKADRILNSVELLVTWSLDDATRTFGDKYKRRKVAGRDVLEFKPVKEEDKKAVTNIVATLDDNGIVRSVKFTKGK